MLKGALVIGGGSGIGRAAAKRLAEDGRRVVIAGNVAREVENSVAEIRQSVRPDAAHGLAVDVREESSVQECIADANVELDGGLGVVVSTAGVFPRVALKDMDESTWTETIDVNLTGTYRVCRHASSLLTDNGGGSIVVIGSIWAKHVWPGRAAYAASKAAVEQFSRAIALELAPLGVRVNAVSPGIMETAMTRDVLQNTSFVRDFMPRVTAGRVGDPYRDLAGVVSFLCSDDAAYMTGEVVTVYGGYY